MKVENVETDKMAGTEEIKDGVKYVYTEPVGIKDGAKLYIYISRRICKQLAGRIYKPGTDVFKRR
ncbi:MAG: hypothetical protein ACLR7D_02100 [Lachnospira eligens]